MCGETKYDEEEQRNRPQSCVMGNSGEGPGESSRALQVPLCISERCCLGERRVYSLCPIIESLAELC
jgi:hypothetical protein